MKSEILKGLGAGVLCWTLAAPAQTSDPEAHKLLNSDAKLEDGLRRAGIVAGRILLTGACLASIAAAVSGRAEGLEPGPLCELFSALDDKLVEEMDKSRTGPRPIVIRRPPPPADPPPAQIYHSASATGPLIR